MHVASVQVHEVSAADPGAGAFQHVKHSRGNYWSTERPFQRAGSDGGVGRVCSGSPRAPDDRVNARLRTNLRSAPLTNDPPTRALARDLTVRCYPPRTRPRGPPRPLGRPPLFFLPRCCRPRTASCRKPLTRALRARSSPRPWSSSGLPGFPLREEARRDYRQLVLGARLQLGSLRRGEDVPSLFGSKMVKSPSPPSSSSLDCDLRNENESRSWPWIVTLLQEPL